MRPDTFNLDNILQGTNRLDHWSINFRFEPTPFEDPSLELLVHRGMYDAAKALYPDIAPLVRQQIASSPTGKVLCPYLMSCGTNRPHSHVSAHAFVSHVVDPLCYHNFPLPPHSLLLKPVIGLPDWSQSGRISRLCTDADAGPPWRRTCR